MTRNEKPDKKGLKTLLFSDCYAVSWQMLSFCLAKGVLSHSKRSPFTMQKDSF